MQTRYTSPKAPLTPRLDPSAFLAAELNGQLLHVHGHHVKHTIINLWNACCLFKRRETSGFVTVTVRSKKSRDMADSDFYPKISYDGGKWSAADDAVRMPLTGEILVRDDRRVIKYIL